MATGEYCRCAW